MDRLSRIDPSTHWVREPCFSISVWGRRQPSRGPPRSTSSRAAVYAGPPARLYGEGGLLWPESAFDAPWFYSPA
jgi:hypothetical protein